VGEGENPGVLPRLGEEENPSTETRFKEKCYVEAYDITEWDLWSTRSVKKEVVKTLN